MGREGLEQRAGMQERRRDLLVSPGLLSVVRLLLLLGELDRSDTTTLIPAVGLRLPPRDEDSLLSEPSDVLERVSDDFLSFPLRKKVLILLRLTSPPSSSS